MSHSVHSSDDEFRLSDSTSACSVLNLRVQQNQFWTTVAQNLQVLIDNSCPGAEYEMLEEEFAKPLHSRSAAEQPTNKKKNRYTNILPYDTTRVVLTPNEEGSSDYINANFVGPEGEYIAAQAPVASSLEDFWKMILQYRVPVIVMLTREYESSKLKAHRYWPGSGTECYGNYTVTLLVEDSIDDSFIMREFLVEGPENQQVKTVQYQFLTWPDHDVPESSAPLVEVMSTIDGRFKQEGLIDSENKVKQPPVAIHCRYLSNIKFIYYYPFALFPIIIFFFFFFSAGIGRTGAFIVIHSKLAALKKIYKAVDEDGTCEIPPVSLMDTLRELRHQRHGMITQAVQYEFCYQTLLKEIQKLANEESLESC